LRLFRSGAGRIAGSVKVIFDVLDQTDFLFHFLIGRQIFKPLTLRNPVSEVAGVVVRKIEE
jgi:hypothetical protein